LWTTEALGPVGQTPGSRKLSAHIAAFEAANLGVRVDVVLKKPYGKGGMLDFLTTTAVAVPNALPDVAILDIRELRVAVQRDLIQPLSGRMTPDVVQDLVAPARVAGQVDNSWFGLPFAADVQHLIYNTSLTPTAPVTWTDVSGGTVQYLFPAGGQAPVTGQGELVNDAFLIQYLGTGARLVGEAGQPALDQDAVAAVLQFYADGLAAGTIPRHAIQHNSLDDIWPIYLTEEVGLADVSAHRYLESRDRFQKSSFAPIPTQKGVVTSLINAWACVLVTREPERQEMAWSLIEWLTRPDWLGDWVLAANYVPTRLSALPENPEDQYLKFLAELLQNSQVRPAGSGHDEMGRALQRAVQAIFTGTATPTEAATQAATSVP
jgi:multiple sugar transport system substrate-binding protein